jgi:PAS domain S-box-containing protein
MDTTSKDSDGMEVREELFATSSEEQRYRTLIDSITDYAICMLDRNGMVASWNTGARRIKGYEASEIIGEHISRFYTEDGRLAGEADKALHTAATEGRCETEGWRVRKDGTHFWAHVVIDPIWGQGKEIVGFAKITRDLTERRLATDALRRSEQQFRLLVQGVTDYAIYMLDPSGKVSSWNAGAQRIKGYAPDEIIGEHYSRFYTEEDRAEGIPARNLQIAAREGRFEREGWRVRKDGTRFMAHVVIDAIRDEYGKVVGFAKVTRDITERVRVQQSLEQAQQVLFQTQKMESIGQLTGGIAHDFNNLLTAVIGSLELLRKRLPDDARAQALLQNALHGAERGATLTQRMLAFARRQELKIEPIKLDDLINGMMGLIERSIGAAIRIDCRVRADLPPVQTDANQLETALLNLAVNGRDAMPDGGVITIAGKEHDIGSGSTLGLKPGRYVCMSVTDCGQGMDKQTLLHATEPFFTTKGAGKGTGLGLSMVHGLAEQSGGKLHIRSELGRGTTVEVWLPVANGMVDAASHGASGSNAPGPSQPMTVLVVDDDELVLLSTSAVLDDLGYTVIEASSGMQALKLVIENPQIDLVLSDQVMPSMTGLQLAHAIAQIRPNLPLILATGFAELPGGVPENIRRLSKPFRLSDLVDIINSAMAGHTSGRRER